MNVRDHQLVDHRAGADFHARRDRCLDVADRAADHDEVLARTDRAGDDLIDLARLEHFVLGHVAEAHAGELDCTDRFAA